MSRIRMSQDREWLFGIQLHAVLTQLHLSRVIILDRTPCNEAPQQNERRLRAILETAVDAIITISHEGIIQSVNPATARLFGYTPEEMIGRNVSALMPTPYRESHDEYIASYLRTGVRKIIGIGREVIGQRKDGTTFPIDLAVSEVEKGRLFTGIIRDVTQRKEMEREIAKFERASRHSQRLESIGTLAGGIAHDLNNMLTPIVLGAQLLKSGRLAEDRREGLLNTMVASAQRGTDLIKKLLAFAGGIRGDRRPVDLSQVISETQTLLEHTLPKSIHMAVHVDPNLPFVLGDATELSQVLMNMCINSRDAMPEGGTLTIEATSFQMTETSRKIHPDAKPSGYVRINIEDTGIGMTPATLERIFDPFFTTKDMGAGTGLGLATSQGIIKSHGGFIMVYSEPGRGSKFTIHIPVTEHASTRDTSSTATADVIGYGHTILVVDDDLLVLQMAKLALESHKFKVITANSGESGLEIVRHRRPEISAVLVDVMMPEMDGIQTLDKIREIAPDLAVIACSGLKTSQREIELLNRGARAFVQKPYTDEILLQTLAQVLKTPNEKQQ